MMQKAFEGVRPDGGLYWGNRGTGNPNTLSVHLVDLLLDERVNANSTDHHTHMPRPGVMHDDRGEVDVQDVLVYGVL